jgi:hypothetical protein
VTHTALYVIDKSDQVEVSVDGGSFTNLGGYSKQISAGLDASGNPEVYAIGGDNAVWLNKGSGWVCLGGYAKEISATVDNTFYHIGTDDAVYLGHGVAGTGFVRLGGQAKQISAGATLADHRILRPFRPSFPRRKNGRLRRQPLVHRPG